MKKIQDQIANIITYDCKDFDSLTVQYENLGNRISEGIAKMQEAKIFTDAEIQEISTFATTLRRDRYIEAKKALIESMRNAFEF